MSTTGLQSKCCSEKSWWYTYVTNYPTRGSLSNSWNHLLATVSAAAGGKSVGGVSLHCTDGDGLISWWSKILLKSKQNIVKKQTVLVKVFLIPGLIKKLSCFSSWSSCTLKWWKVMEPKEIRNATRWADCKELLQFFQNISFTISHCLPVWPTHFWNAQMKQCNVRGRQIKHPIETFSGHLY